MNEEDTIANGAAAAVKEVTEIIEPFEKLRDVLQRLVSTQIAGSDAEVEGLNRQGAPALHAMARDLRKHPRIKKLRKLVASCRPALEEMLGALTAIEKGLRGE
jgi:hypothetical protein